MLKKTFCHTIGISQDTEQKLWANDINSWEEFLENYENIKYLTPSQLQKIKTEILFSQEYLEENNLKYFKEKLHPKEHYRLSKYGKIAYLDIETTGLSKYSNDITILGIYDGETPHIYIQGQNLEDAKEKLKEFDIIVTFNGKMFDLPFIEYKFGTKYDFIHLDLRFMLSEFGLTGGLKKIEKAIGISRPDEVADVNGFEAVRLWKRYIYGDQSALAKLIKYNEEDIINLKTLLEYYLQKKQENLQESLQYQDF